MERKTEIEWKHNRDIVRILRARHTNRINAGGWVLGEQSRAIEFCPPCWHQTFHTTYIYIYWNVIFLDFFFFWQHGAYISSKSQTEPSSVPCNYGSMSLEGEVYQDHVSSGDVHVGGYRLLTPGGGAAAGWGAGHRPIAELRRHTVQAWVTQRLRALPLLRGTRCHALTT